MMNLFPQKGVAIVAEAIKAMNLDVLFEAARAFGLVNIFTHDDGTYSVTIKIPTINGISLEGKSGFGHQRAATALIAAIEKAEQIKKQFGVVT